MNKKSLYTIITSLCAVACAFTVVAVNTSKTSKKKNEVLKANEEIVKNEITSTFPKESPKNETKTEENITKETNTVQEEAKIQESEIPVLPEPITVCEPISNGEILNNFTDSVLVFNETYGDYRTHNGVDILAKIDSPVVAVKKGIVTKNEFDYEDGYTVEIEHDDGLVSVYKNLSNDKTVKVGQVVGAGETIGTIGDSGISESNMDSHLHFEIREDNVEVDPTKYITFSN